MIVDLKHRITIQQPVLTPDGAGGFAESWQNIATAPDVYAAITPVDAGAQLKFGQIAATATHHITLRYRADITPVMRLVGSDGTIYTPVSVTDQEGQKRYLQLAATVRRS